MEKATGSLATGKVEGERHWYRTREGQTMVVIPGPVEFLMGSPSAEADQKAGFEQQHRLRIGRSFAVADSPVTVIQYLAFLDAYRNLRLPSMDSDRRKFAPAADCPMIAVQWYEAAAYCNWLSKKEGIPEEQWCYATNAFGQYAEGMKRVANMLSRTGYRLPTEAEWECACRAGTVTCRYYGETDELLPKYAWFENNSKQRTWPVGNVKPNDFGLFDMQGNVYQWCQDAFALYPRSLLDANEVPADEAVASDKVSRVLRGGGFPNRPKDVRSAERLWFQPNTRFGSGFRVARTYNCSPLPPYHLPAVGGPR